MFLRSLALSKKLFAAILLPVALVIGFLGLRIGDAVSDRNAALTQLDETDRFEAVNEFADAVSREGGQYFDFVSTSENLAATRAEVDAELDALLNPELGIRTSVLQRMVDLHAELLAVREVLGDNPSNIVSGVNLELLGLRDESAPSLVEAVFEPTSIYARIIQAYEFDRDSITGAEQAQLLDSYTLVQNLRVNYRDEANFFNGASEVTALGVTQEVTGRIARDIALTDNSLSVLRTFATPETVAAVEAIQNGDNNADYEVIRDVFRTAPTGFQIQDLLLDDLPDIALTSSTAEFDGPRPPDRRRTASQRKRDSCFG